MNLDSPSEAGGGWYMMPDVSMVQQALNSANGDSEVAITSAGTFTPRNFGTQTSLSRSQCQVAQFLNSGSVFSTISGCRQPIKTPVMHPNLVCTLKSILSPKIEFDPQSSVISPGTSPFPEMAQESFEGRINALTAVDSSPKTTSSENTPWSNMQVSESKAKLLQQQEEAVLVSVDLIQNRRPYQCAFAGCQRTFKNPQTMRMHHKTHFSDAAAAKLGADSSQAVAAAALPQSLKAGHNKKIPSRCPTCYKTFVGLYELRRHFGRKHSEGEKSHACRKCGKRFHIEVDLRDHEKLCGEPIVCSCGMKFAFKCNLVAHKRSHPKCQDRQENGFVVTPENSIKQEVVELRTVRLVHRGMTEIRSLSGSPRSKRRKLLDPPSALSPPPKAAAETTPTSSQLSPVQPFAILDSASASSSSPFSSTTSSPSTSFVAEALPDFDVTSSSSLDYHYNSSLSSGLLQAHDSYIKFPLDQYFLAYQAVPSNQASS